MVRKYNSHWQAKKCLDSPVRLKSRLVAFLVVVDVEAVDAWLTVLAVLTAALPLDGLDGSQRPLYHGKGPGTDRRRGRRHL